MFCLQVADFGLAKFASDNNTHVSTRVMGTFGYASFLRFTLCFGLDSSLLNKINKLFLLLKTYILGVSFFIISLCTLMHFLLYLLHLETDLLLTISSLQFGYKDVGVRLSFS